jgi:hypothetical protein
MLNWWFSEHDARRSRPFDRKTPVVFRNPPHGLDPCAFHRRTPWRLIAPTWKKSLIWPDLA